MEAVDKFGRPIFQHIFRRLQAKGRTLESLGYREASSKPNLFVCKYDLVIFFADMRGTDIIPIWDDPSPLFYWNFLRKDIAVTVRQQAVLIEWCRIEAVDPRLSNELHDDWDVMMEAALVSDYRYNLDSPDGSSSM